jgi:hypothetical protein
MGLSSGKERRKSDLDKEKYAEIPIAIEIYWIILSPSSA